MSRKCTIFCLSLLSLLLVFNHLLAQQGELSTESQRAIKHYYKGTEWYRIRDYAKAEEYLLQAISADNKFSEAYLALGDVYADKKEYEKAITSYRKSLSEGRKQYPLAHYYIAKLEHRTGKYDAAIADYQATIDNTTRNEEREAVIKSLIDDCNFALSLMANPLPFNPKNLGPAINSARSEYFPCLTVDGQTLLFTRREPFGTDGHEQEDFYMATKTDTTWNQSKAVGVPINTEWNEGAPTLSPDGQFLIFTACANAARDYGPNRDGYGSCDLFISRRLGEEWSEPSNLGNPVNSGYWETQPSFAADGKTLYFVRGYRDSNGDSQQDIFTSELSPNGHWSQPQRLPSIINSPGREESVFIHPDGNTLYFASDGHPGMGGLDIFMSRRDSAGQWSKPVNLGYPINTFRDENSLVVSGDGKLGYFASDRKGGYGLLDLYSFEMPAISRPQSLTYLKGTVYDYISGQKLEARFELIDIETGTPIVNSLSNPVNGEFLVAIPSGKSYALNVSRKDYLFYSEHFNFIGNHGIENPFLRDVPLQPIRVGESIVLHNVFFDTDSYLLKPESVAELDKLVALLNDNESMKIEISGHTDNQGNQEYNRELSLNRARAVYDYLSLKNISTGRLSYKGFGETQPIDDNTTDKGRAQNRRTAIKIVGI